MLDEDYGGLLLEGQSAIFNEQTTRDSTINHSVANTTQVITTTNLRSPPPLNVHSATNQLHQSFKPVQKQRI